MDKDSIREILNGGSIDHPSDLMMKMMKHPITMLRLAPLMIRTKFRGMR
jgi:hypothetical protein